MQYLRNQIARQANINVETLRYYERIGLLSAPERDGNGYRIYSEDTLKRLEMIRYAKSCGLTLEETKEIVSLLGDINNIDYALIIKLADQKIASIEQRVLQLNRIKETLNKIKTNINSNITCPIKSSFQNP